MRSVFLLRIRDMPFACVLRMGCSAQHRSQQPTTFLKAYPMTTFTVHTIDNAPEASKPILQAVMETKHQLDVLDRRLDESPYLAGDQYTIADIAVWSWNGKLVRGDLYSAA